MLEVEGCIPMTEEEIDDLIARCPAAKIRKEDIDYAHWQGGVQVIMMKPVGGFNEQEFLEALSAPFAPYRAIHKKT